MVEPFDKLQTEWCFFQKHVLQFKADNCYIKSGSHEQALADI